MLFYIGQFLISALCHGLGYVSLGISYFYKWPSFQNTGRKVHHLAGVYGSSFPIILALQDMAVEGVCSLYIHRVFLRVCTAPSDNAGRCTNRVPQYAFPVFRNIPESDFFRHHPVIRLPQFLLVCKNLRQGGHIIQLLHDFTVLSLSRAGCPSCGVQMPSSCRLKYSLRLASLSSMLPLW